MQKTKLSSIITFLLIMAILLPSQTLALIPYTRSSIWDSIFDPFKILEHSPLDIPKGSVTDDGAVALAHAGWKESPAAHEILLDIPGMKKEDIKIEVEAENRVLSVSGERKAEEEVKDERWHRVERTVGKFWRQFKLPANADVENVKARLVNGVLRITVPKSAGGEKKKVIAIVSDDKEDVVKAAKA